LSRLGIAYNVLSHNVGGIVQQRRPPQVPRALRGCGRGRVPRIDAGL